MLIRYLTVKVKKHDLKTNYFEKKNDFKVYAPTRQELDLFDDNLCFKYINLVI